MFESYIHSANMTNYVNEYIAKVEPFANSKIAQNPNGRNYSVFGFMIEFRRHTKPYIWSYYLTSMCVVTIAGCSFIVPPKCIPGRLALLVTLFLVQMQMIKDIQSILPYSDSLTGMSVFSLISLFFIFIALLEYASILMATRLKESFDYNIKWNSETVDFISMVFYIIGIIIFIISYINLYV